MSVVLALVAACKSKACAPPPVGTGGSDQGASSSSLGGALNKSFEMRMAASPHKAVLDDSVGEDVRDEMTRAWHQLEHYMDQGYIGVNDALRMKPEKFRSGTDRRMISDMDLAFDHFGVRVEKESDVWRGMILDRDSLGVPDKATPEQHMQALEKWLSPGREFVDKGFVSTSEERGEAMKFTIGYDSPSVIMRIKLPEGTRVVRGTVRESEALLDRGSQFRVVGAKRASSPETPYLLEVDVELVQ